MRSLLSRLLARPRLRTPVWGATRLRPLLLLAFAACATNPVTGKRELSLISEGDEVAMGRQAAQDVRQSMGLVPDSALQRYVSSLGQRLAAKSERPGLPWQFGVVEDPMVNAFALPGGPVFITRGILSHMNSEAQLVSVLGHEIGHITAKHSVSQISKAQLAQLGLGVAMIARPELQRFGNLAGQGLGLLFLKFGRDDEMQADELGFRYMVSTGYQPAEMAEMFQTLQRLGGEREGRIPEWMSTHPDPGNRVQQTMQRIAATTLPGGLQVDRDRFLQATEGLVFGENPRLGFFEGAAFLHPDLRFRFDFPAGWKTQNQSSQVVGISPQQDAIVVLTLAGATAPAQALQQFLGQQGIQSRGTSAAPINGLPAALGGFVAQTQEGTLGGWVAFVQLDGTTYRLLGYTPAPRASAYDAVLRQAVSSFRRLTDAAALAVKPARLRLVRTPRPMTIEEFQRDFPSTIPVAQLALINGVEPTTRLPAGMLVKRVVTDP